MTTTEIFWYEDFPMNQLVIGKRGGSEYRMNLHEFRQMVLRKRIDHKLTPEMVWRIVFEESQCVEFEEVREPQKLIG